MNPRTARRLCAALLAVLSPWAMAQDERVVAHGLIVQLKNAPPHVAEREDLLARESLLATERTRWQRVLRESGIDAPGRAVPTLRPTGRSAQLLRFERPLSATEANRLAERLRARPDVEWVAPNVREKRLQTAPNAPTDSRYADQWWLHPVSGSNANTIDARLRGVPSFLTTWQQRHVGAATARVAVLDSGRAEHPDLNGQWVGGYDFVADPVYSNDGNGRDGDPSDPGDWVDASDNLTGCAVEPSSWHGTIIAGLIAATHDNGGVASVNRNGAIVPVRVAGKCGAEPADIVDGMRWAAGLPVAGAPANPFPAKIVNISFGGTGDCTPYQAAIDELRANNVVVVAAAGNEYTTPTRPAKCPGVIAVGALNRDGFKTNYSNLGPEVTISTVGGDDGDGNWGTVLADSGLLTVNLPSPREPGVVNLGDASGYARMYGTSFSAPLVSGAISLMLSANPQLTYDEIVAGLRASARPHVTSPKIGACSTSNPGRCICTTTTCGAGILDADEAVRYAAELAAGRSYQAPSRPIVVIDNADIDRAVALAAQDRGTVSNPPPGTGNPPPSTGGGGGAMSWAWLLGLIGATGVLRRRR